MSKTRLKGWGALFSFLPVLTLNILITTSAQAGEALTLGIHPFLPATELVRKFDPLAKYLSSALDRPVRVEISRDYKDHIEKIGSGILDVAYMGPASYVQFVEAYGEKPLLARLEVDGRPTFHGVIFVRDESRIRNLQDAAGKSFAFVGAASTMGYIVPRHVLMREGVAPGREADFTFLNNHDNVALAVLVGDFDVGAVKEETFRKYEPRGARAIATTPPISEHLFVASADLPGDTVEALRTALLQISASSEGLEAVRSIKATATNLVPVNNEHYDNLREILDDFSRQEALR
jgi:phosphonate transport system substrate-binding protein